MIYLTRYYQDMSGNAAKDGLFHVSLEKAIQCPPAPVLEHFTRVVEAIGSAVAGPFTMPKRP